MSNPHVFPRWLLAVTLGAGLLLAGCGTPHSAAAPRSSPRPAHHHGSRHTVPPVHAQSALRVPAAFQHAFAGALQAFRAATPRWAGFTAPAGTVVYEAPTLSTSGVSLAAAWHQWQGFAGHGASPSLALTQALTTGTNGATGLPSVGIPVGQSNLSATAPNVAVATGVVTVRGTSHAFTAVLARLASGWVLVTWRWL